MTEEKTNVIDLKKRVENDSRSALDEIIQLGAQRLLQTVIEKEVIIYLERHQHMLDEQGHRLVVRNGHLPEREIHTGAGPLLVKKPRVHDRREGHRFTSKILPPYMRRSPSIDALIPALYLKGISTGDFTDALQAILGEGASGLSATNIVRLKEGWMEEYREWSRRDLTGKRYVYFWADGIYFNVRLTPDRPCMLVVIGTTSEGKKELLGLLDGERESKLSWKDLLLDLKQRGLKEGPELAVGDGALGFWAALREVYPKAKEQRCWVHKTANILDKMPKKVRKRAKEKIHGIYMAETKKEALEAFDEFINLYEVRYPKACTCLKKDKDVLFTFYDFPVEHWRHIRSTNPIESTFATVRHRTRQTKGCGSREATLMMVYKLGREAEKHWQRIGGYQLVGKVMGGVRFVDGIEEKDDRKAA